MDKNLFFFKNGTFGQKLKLCPKLEILLKNRELRFLLIKIRFLTIRSI